MQNKPDSYVQILREETWIKLNFCCDTCGLDNPDERTFHIFYVRRAQSWAEIHTIYGDLDSVWEHINYNNARKILRTICHNEAICEQAFVFIIIINNIILLNRNAPIFSQKMASLPAQLNHEIDFAVLTAWIKAKTIKQFFNNSYCKFWLCDSTLYLYFSAIRHIISSIFDTITSLT